MATRIAFVLPLALCAFCTLVPQFSWAADHRVCVEWLWLGKDVGFRDVSPRPPYVPMPPMQPVIDWDGFNYDQDAEDDYGRRDQPGDFAPRRMLAQVTDGTNVLWGWNFLDQNGCTGIFDTSASDVYFQAYPWSKWSSTGNQIVVLDCTSGDCEFSDIGAPVELPVSMGVQDINYTSAFSSIGYKFAIHWAMSFSEERQAYHEDQLFYGALWPSMQTGIKGAQSDRLIGGRPTISMKNPGADARLKYDISHEYGHLQTLVLIDPGILSHEYLDYCYHIVNKTHCNNSMGIETLLNHTFTSPEWQSAAAAEGFAHFYSMSVWNDLGESFGVRARNSDAGNNILDTTEIEADRTDDSPASLYIAAMYSDDGIATERDWAFFLWDLVNGTNPFDIELVMRWLSLAWQWPSDDLTTDWWTHFRSEATFGFSMTQLSKFDGHAATRGVNQ